MQYIYSMQIFDFNRFKFDYKKYNQVESCRINQIVFNRKKNDFDYLRLIFFNRKKSNSLILIIC
jgi:hypothetical protein